MPKGLFLYEKRFDKNLLTGIDKKVVAQISEFNKAELNFDFYFYSLNASFTDKILSFLPFTNRMPKWQYNCLFDNIQYLYLRRPAFCNMYFIKLLKEIRRRNPNIKIVMEIPTYPYIQEYLVTWKRIPYLIKEIWNRRKLKGLVDRFALLSDLPELLGIKALKISNGINISEVTPKKVTESSGCINVCAVAMFSKWHGYERFIKGLNLYYKTGKKRNIVLYLVGDGSESHRYAKLIKKYHLEHHVKMLGYLSGSELDTVYDSCELALDVLAMYTKGNYLSYSLKSREYFARGLPVISGCDSDLIQEHWLPYYLQIPNNSSPVDIGKIVAFYDKIYYKGCNKIEIINNLREYISRTSNWEYAMSNVTAFFKDTAISGEH